MKSKTKDGHKQINRLIQFANHKSVEEINMVDIEVDDQSKKDYVKDHVVIWLCLNLRKIFKEIKNDYYHHDSLILMYYTLKAIKYGKRKNHFIGQVNIIGVIRMFVYLNTVSCIFA